MTVEVVTMVDRGMTVAEDMTEVAEGAIVASVVETTIATKAGMIVQTAVSIAMVEGQEVRGMTIEGDLTQL